MGLYAIGDLHFSTENPKPMNIFGDNWDNHEKKIVDNWSETVKDDDTVLVLGDTSWSMNLNEAKSDLDIIESLPGKKIFIKGNHDYWWSSLSKINAVYESDDMNFIQNGYFTYGDYAIFSISDISDLYCFIFNKSCSTLFTSKLDVYISL